ncbi:hypothetical protein [Paenarthrobacter ureafaciens]|uniref:hypothetical protein n=1 Tax=Paenarthrobacter ureafaciens TaxID=37931 RepID=UPI001FB516FE|nr:hypothetical protein [Paenarthrobacter ureafaciens]UOD83354.1 hypothetical protein MQZ73_20390 [Paenarthrobacter ureafaciens]WNZ04316.1 hypothetical protein PVT25_01790 [Paenarthrobacter ureafaciens]
MTLDPEKPQTRQNVEVRFSPDGTPLAIRHDGRIWMVDPDVHTAHWYTRDAWWETRNRAAIGTGDLVSIEHWQVQATLPSAGAELRTFTLRREPLAAEWQLESIS